MHVVAILSLKGGVGKTTVALGIASAALRRGTRALVIDLDPQGNSTSSLDPPYTEATLVDVLRNPQQEKQREILEKAIAPSAWGDELDVLVGSEGLEALNDPQTDEESLANLSLALDELSEAPTRGQPYELVILDCPPSLGRLTKSALVAADSALLVTEPTMYAVSGARRALDAIYQIRDEHNPYLRPAGVLVNKLRVRSHEHQFRIAELRETFGHLVMPTAIPDRLAVQQAQGACAAIHDWNSPGAQEIALTFNMVLAKIIRSDRSGRHRIFSDLDADPGFGANPETNRQTGWFEDDDALAIPAGQTNDSSMNNPSMNSPINTVPNAGFESKNA